ncbi:MAG: tyrosine--tRNA ligase [Candidatus Gracilibacteria bacterium]
MDPISELLTRGVAHCIVKEDLEKKLRSGKKLTIKLGCDPTGANLHIGHAIAIRALKRFQDLGHDIIFIVGDATGMIGDTSDKDSMRVQLEQKQVEENMRSWKEQVGKILDLSKIAIRYNSEWLGKLNFMDVANLAKHFTVAQMLERDNYWKRFEASKPIGLHEFMYPLMQGYDSVAIKADVELGGDDQLFNILAGRVLQEAFEQVPQNVLTFELLEGTDGRKMSKSYGNGINLLDTPKDMFGKTMSMKDELIIRYFILCTDKSMEDIKKIEADLLAGLNPRDAKIMLAKELVTMYHSAEDGEREAGEFMNVFSKGEIPTDVEEAHVAQDSIALLDVIMQYQLLSSKGEAKRLIDQGGITLDGEKITAYDHLIVLSDTKQLLKVGKRKYLYLVK